MSLQRSLIHDSTARFSVKRQPDQVSDKDSMKIIHVDRDALILRNDVLQFEQMQLQLAATQIPGLESEIVGWDQLHAEHRLIEPRGLVEVLRPTDR